LGGQTYVAQMVFGTGLEGIDPDPETGATLVIVTRGGGTSSPAPTSSMLQADLEAGPADGLLVWDNGLREILEGAYDPNVVAEEGEDLPPNLTVGSAGGVSFEGIATSSDFFGILTVEDVDTFNDLSGFGEQEDAPLIHLLGLWTHETDITVTCETLGVFELQCEGFTRVRQVGRHQRVDTYEACGTQPSECLLASGPSLTDGTWRGLEYSESTAYSRSYENCPVDIAGDLSILVTSRELSSRTSGTITFVGSGSAGAECPPLNTECLIEQSMSATRCVDCWPASCDDSF
jgi:hypothetical protein